MTDTVIPESSVGKGIVDAVAWLGAKFVPKTETNSPGATGEGVKLKPLTIPPPLIAGVGVDEASPTRCKS